MNTSVPIRSAWEVGDTRFREVGHPGVPTMADTGEIDLRGFLRTLYRRKWMLLATMGACMGATTLWLSLATPYYDADVLIVVETRPTSIVRVDEKVQDVISDSAKVNTEVAVLELRGLASRVIEDLGLDHDPEFAVKASGGSPFAGAAEGEGWRGLLRTEPLAGVAQALSSARSFLTDAWAGVDSGSPLTPRETPREEPVSDRAREVSAARDAAALLDEFLKRLSVEPEEGSRLIRIGFTSTDPAKAALIANRLVDEYMQSQLETKTEGARRAAEWLEARLAELGETVRSLEQSVQRQRTEAGSNSIGIVSQRLAQINLQLIEAHAARGRLAGALRAGADRGRERRQARRAARDHQLRRCVQAIRGRQAELLSTPVGQPDDLWREPPADRLAARRDRRRSSRSSIATSATSCPACATRWSPTGSTRRPCSRPRGRERGHASAERVRGRDRADGGASAGQPGPLPQPARALHRGGGAARQPAARRAHHLAGAGPARPVLPELAAGDRARLRRLGLARACSSW